MSQTKMYSVLDKWTDLDTENIVDFTSVDGVVTEARVNGVPAGGGGVTTRTITGTLANPFGDEAQDILDAVKTHNSFGEISIDFSILVPGVVFKCPIYAPSADTLTLQLSQAEFNSAHTAIVAAIFASWQIIYNIIADFDGIIYNQGQVMDIAQYASNIPTTLTLYEVG